MFFRIGKEIPLLHQVQARVDPRLERGVALLGPMPYRLQEEQVAGQLRGGIGHGDAEQRAVVEHQGVRTPVSERDQAFEKDVVTISFVSLK